MEIKLLLNTNTDTPTSTHTQTGHTHTYTYIQGTQFACFLSVKAIKKLVQYFLIKQKLSALAKKRSPPVIKKAFTKTDTHTQYTGQRHRSSSGTARAWNPIQVLWPKATKRQKAES